MNAFIKTFFNLFGKAGLKALINFVAQSDMFKDFVHGLIMKRLSGLKETQPELYTSIDGYATAVASLPQIFTDEDTDDLGQVAVAFRLEQLERSMSMANTLSFAISKQAKTIKINLGV